METKWTWETIVDKLTEEFQKDIYVKGEKMPSENKMAVRFQVPRSEIRKAYERLKELGYVYSMQGYGSFFSGRKEKIRLVMNDESFSHKMNVLGPRFETRNAGFRKIHDASPIHSMLGVNYEDSVYKITRLRLLDEQPIAIHISYLSEKHFPHLSEDGNDITSVHAYMHKNGFSLLKSENAQLTVSSLSKKERELLDIQGYAPCLVLTNRCVILPDKTVVEVARTIYRSDKFIFEL